MMILPRVLLLGALLWLGWMIWRQWRGPAAGKSPEALEKMVRCAQCGQHVPKAWTVEVDGQRRCRDHAQDG